MLRRKFYGQLVEWKQNKGRECLLVKGARQIGKTYIIDYFGKKDYEEYISINFLEQPELKKIFEGSLEPEVIYKNISLYLKDVHFIEGNTLIFLDEIQACRAARTALKFLAIDQRYDVIASGSLLGIHYKEDEENEEDYSIPVGYEREVEMCALDFEEYLWAMGVSEEAVGFLKQNFLEKKKIEPGTNEHFRKLFYEYMVVGGMPEVVNTFLETNNYQAVYETQKKILKAYQADIEKYAKNTDIPKIKNIYYSIPRQLAKEYTKFQYKTVEKNGSARKYENAIDWLIDAGMIKKVLNVSLPMLPLRAYEKPEEFKIYATDIGLTMAMFGYETQRALLKGEFSGPAKGGLFENLIFDVLIKRGVSVNYYKKPDSTQEIEFLFEKDGAAIPVEVKSGRGETISLNEFMEKYKPPYAYKLTAGNIGVVENKISMPQYMAMFL